MNNEKLGIFSVNIGLQSETFIRQHIEKLAPGNTAVVTHGIHEDGTWAVDCPLYIARNTLQMGLDYPKLVRKLVPWSLINPGDRRGISRFLAAQGVTAILGEYLHDSWILLPIVRKLGIRFYPHAHGYDLSRFFKDELWRKRYRDYKHADGVIVVNNIMKERLLSVGVPEKRIHLVPYGVDVPDGPRTRPRRKQTELLAVGRMVGKKAPLTLLQSFQKALDSNRELILHMVGDGVLLPDAQRFVSEQELGENVQLHGSKDHAFVKKLMERCDCFVQHSVLDPETGDEEGIPVSIMEAMAHAMPVISTIHAWIPDAVVDELTGFLVPEGDVEGLAARMLQLCDNVDRRIEMGVAGWNRAREKFSSRRELEDLRLVMGLSPCPEAET